VADSCLHARLFVGERHQVRPDQNTALWVQQLKHCQVSLFRGEALVEVGHGSNVLGSPLLALQQVLKVIEQSAPQYRLAPGEIITTGTLTNAHLVQPQERWNTQFAGTDFLPGLTIDFLALYSNHD
jgi:2-keto-4-pentenoate hydratase